MWSALPLFGNVLLQVMHPERRLLAAALWTSVVYCYVVALSLWATARLAQQIADLEPLVKEVSLRSGWNPFFQGIDGCDVLGLETGDYSFACRALGRWTSDVVKGAADRAIGCATQILNGLES